MTNKTLDGSRPKTLEDLALSFCNLESASCVVVYVVSVTIVIVIYAPWTTLWNI